MPADTPADQRLVFNEAKLKEMFDISNFDFNAIIRGIQLTLVGGTSIS